jgi:N-acetylglucosamine kinase-like BadF-type ATPase
MDPPAYAREIRRLLGRIKRVAAKLRADVTAVGLGGHASRDWVSKEVRDVFGPVPVVQAGECEVAFAVYGMQWGVALVAGTGSSCRAVNEAGETAGCGGFGPQFGDEGSGYWIGRMAITAAMAANDGRGLPTSLGERLCAFYGLSRVWEIFQLADRSGHVAGPRIAAFVPHVVEAVRQGDAVALEICHEAGRQLGALAVATVRRLTWRETPVPLVATGGVFHAGPFVTRSMQHVLRHSPVALKLHPPTPDPIQGILSIINLRRTRRRK